WYVGTLVPVIGLVQVGGQAYADRYTYLPQVGLLLAVCWSVADLDRAWQQAALALAVAAALPLAFLTRGQLQVWHDSVSLSDHCRRVARPSPLTLDTLGAALKDRGDDAGAARYFREAIELDPTYDRAHKNLGNLLFKHGRLDEAVGELREACRLAPEFALPHT